MTLQLNQIVKSFVILFIIGTLLQLLFNNALLSFILCFIIGLLLERPTIKKQEQIKPQPIKNTPPVTPPTPLQNHCPNCGRTMPQEYRCCAYCGYKKT